MQEGKEVEVWIPCIQDIFFGNGSQIDKPIPDFEILNVEGNLIQRKLFEKLAILKEKKRKWKQSYEREIGI